jgi:hypothetical protein
MSGEIEAGLEPVSDEDVIEHLKNVVSRIATRLAELVPEESRSAARDVLNDELFGDEGARELLGAAYNEGRADARKSAALSGEGCAPDWSDVESLGERRAIATEETACSSCSHAPVCAIRHAAEQLGALVLIQRCDRYT